MGASTRSPRRSGGRTVGRSLRDQYDTLAPSLVLRVSQDSPSVGDLVATEVVPSSDGLVHVEVLAGHRCADPSSQVELSAHEAAERFVIEVRLHLAEADGEARGTGVAPQPPTVRFAIPSGVTATSLECRRGPVAVEALPCEQLGLLAVGGDVAMRRCGGFVVVAVGHGSLALEGLDGEANCSVGDGVVDARSCRGRLRLHTGSGDLSVAEFLGSALSLECGQGSISVRESLAESLSVRAKQGYVSLTDFSSAALSVSVGAGGCLCAGDLLEGTHSLEVERGDLSIEAAPGTPLRFDLSTGAGEIACPLPSVQVGRRGRPSGRGQRLVGVQGAGTVHLNASVGRGDLELRLGPARVPSANGAG